MPKTNIKITIITLFALFGGFSSASSALASEITVENVIDLVNQEREKAGLVLLAENEDLSRAALAKAQDMVEKDYFAHTSPEGLTPWHWIEKSGYEYEFAGENLAINFLSAEKQNDALMNSATHRKNILGKQFNEIGVAVATKSVNGRKTTITVQQFGNRGVAVVAPERKVAKQEEKLSSESRRAFLIDSSLAAGQNSLMGKPGRLFADKNGLSFVKSFLAVLLFSFIVVTVLEVLRRLYMIESLGRNGKGFSCLLNDDGCETLPGNWPTEMEKIRIIYLDQMKRRE